jgi:hypothetical protein
MQTFKLPEGVRFSEELGFIITFQEVKVRGSDKQSCQVIVTEEGIGVDVNEIFDFKSWEDMKEQYPTMTEFLFMLSEHEYWFSSGRDYDRIYFVAQIEGNEGLYDLHDTVWFDAQDVNEDDELFDELIQKELSPPSPKKKKSTKKSK